MFQTKMGSVNDHAAIVKKPLSMKTSYNNSSVIPREHREPIGSGPIERDSREHRERERTGAREITAGPKFGHNQGQLKRSPSFSTSLASGNSHHSQHGPPPPKKHKISSVKDVTIAEAGKYGSLNDYAFFDKVKNKFFLDLLF